MSGEYDADPNVSLQRQMVAWCVPTLGSKKLHYATLARPASQEWAVRVFILQPDFSAVRSLGESEEPHQPH